VGRDSTKSISNEWVAVDWTSIGDDSGSDVGKGFLDQDWALFGTTGSSQVSSAIDAFDWSSISETQVDKLGSGWGLGLSKNDLGGETVTSITNSIGARASDLQASGVGAFGDVNTGIRTAANGINPDTDEAVETFGDRLGKNIGSAIGAALSVYIAGRAFSEVLNQITGIEVPEPILKGIGLGAGVMKLFGKDLGDSIKGLFDEGGIGAAVFGEGMSGMLAAGGTIAAIAFAAAFTAQFVPDMKKIIGGILGGEIGDVISGITGYMKKNADVLKQVSMGAIDLTGFFTIGQREEGLEEFEQANRAARDYSRKEGVSGEELFETALRTKNIGLLAAAPGAEGDPSQVSGLRYIEDPALVNKMAERVELAFGALIAELFAKAVGATGAADRKEAQAALGRAIKAQGGTEGMAQSIGIGKSTFLGTGGYLDVPGEETPDPYAEQWAGNNKGGDNVVVSRGVNPETTMQDSGNVIDRAFDSLRHNFSRGGKVISLSALRDWRTRGGLEPALDRLGGGVLDGMEKDLLIRAGEGSLGDHNRATMAFQKIGSGITIRARHGAVVPGPPSRETGAIVHGGERILSREEQNAQGGVTISNTFVINGNGDDELMRLIEASMPRIQSQIETTLTKRSRFGQFSIDSRAIRTVLAD
jgi:hypothetical protein